jgi:hypothetical protein
LEGLDGALRVASIVLQALGSFAAAARAGFGVFFSVSFAVWGHGNLLRTVLIALRGMKATMSHSFSDCKPQRNQTPTRRRYWVSVISL